MSPVDKALWYIENNLYEPLILADIAFASDVSAFHLARAFVSTTGYAPIQYLRARRLSEAARQLRLGATDILSLALNSGYNSHEAFTRSFVDMFGISPSKYRQQQNLSLSLLDPIHNAVRSTVTVNEPRHEAAPDRLIAGLDIEFSTSNRYKIPLLWQRLSKHFSAAEPPYSPYGFGVVSNKDSENFRYLAGVEIINRTAVPEDTNLLLLAAQNYLVFSHEGHLGELASLISTLWNQWLPASTYRPTEAPFFSKVNLHASPKNTPHKTKAEICIPIEHA